MTPGQTLEAAILDQAPEGPHADPRDGLRAAAGAAVLEMALAAVALADLLARPALQGSLGAATGDANSDGDKQRRLDLIAEDLFSYALRRAGVGPYLSEEVEAAGLLDPTGVLAVAIDPLDGSSNIDVNAPVGTIFSIFPTVPGATEDPAAAFRQPGRAQIGAGFFIYGPQTALILSLGRGVDLFALDRETGGFVLAKRGLTIPEGQAEYAINASNARHWRAPVQRYIADCERGIDGPRGRNFNMRWIASMVADCYRIFTRGGVFLYPADARKGYEHGRLRLMYEANPIAFLAEQAGGAATDGVNPVLDILPETPHQRAPLVMGAADEVARVRGYHLEAD
jgi:fructose-1,6-bisphosphatase I